MQIYEFFCEEILIFVFFLFFYIVSMKFPPSIYFIYVLRSSSYTHIIHFRKLFELQKNLLKEQKNLDKKQLLLRMLEICTERLNFIKRV